MYYKTLIDQKNDGWKRNSVLRDAGRDNLVYALAYKTLAHERPDPQYTPEELKGSTFLHRVCQDIGITSLQVEGARYRWSMRVNHSWFHEAEVIETSLQAVMKIGSQILKDPKTLQRLSRVSHQLDTQKKLNRAISYGGMLVSVGMMIAETAGIIPFSASGFWSTFVDNMLEGAIFIGAGRIGSFAAFHTLRELPLARLQTAATPAVYRAWIDAAQEQGHSRIIVKNKIGQIELTPERKSRVIQLIDDAIAQPATYDDDWVFAIDVLPADPDLRGNCLSIYAHPAEDRKDSPRWNGKKPKRERKTVREWWPAWTAPQGG